MADSLIDRTVRHEVFGKGTIIGEEPRKGREPLVQVRFENDDRPIRMFYKKDLTTTADTTISLVS